MPAESTATAEVRWFVEGEVPAPVAAWFEGLGAPVEPETRADRYLVPPDGDGIGVKVRAAHDGTPPRLDVKHRTGRLGRVVFGRSEAVAEGWRKASWALEEPEAPAEGWAAVHKARRQRHHAVGEATCALELAALRVDGAAWWSVCLEASGPTETARWTALRETGRVWLDHPEAPALAAADARGYPAWLVRLRRTAGSGAA